MFRLDDEQILDIRMLKGFRIIWNGQEMIVGKNISGKMLHLLMMLMYAGNGGVKREVLLNELYPGVEESAAANSLRVMIYRLRKDLLDSGLPEGDYIINKGGRYRWNYSFLELEIDVENFRRKAMSALGTKDNEAKIALLEEACNLYDGEFLPELMADEWVAASNRKYQELYFKCLRELVKLLEEKEKYDELLEYCEHAVKNYPQEEWQIVKLKTLAALKRYEEAMTYYEKLAEESEREYHIPISYELTNEYELIKEKLPDEMTSLDELQGFLLPSGSNSGASKSDYPTFIKIYRYLVWILKRYKVPACVAMFTILDDEGNPMEDLEKLEEIRYHLQISILESIRKADLYTHYGKNQFLMLMVGTDKKGSEVAASRICRRYRELCRREKADICFTCQTAWEVSDEIFMKNYDKNQKELK